MFISPDLHILQISLFGLVGPFKPVFGLSGAVSRLKLSTWPALSGQDLTKVVAPTLPHKTREGWGNHICDSEFISDERLGQPPMGNDRGREAIYCRVSYSLRTEHVGTAALGCPPSAARQWVRGQSGSRLPQVLQMGGERGRNRIRTET